MDTKQDKKPTVAVCMIVKNESVLLPRCLDSVKDADAIYITDTGSHDDTIDIAKKYTNNISIFPWEDNFAKARNFAKKDVKEDFIVSLDADEYVHDFSKVREAVELAEAKGALAINVEMVAEDHTKQTFYFPRIFKNDPRVWWEGAIHNHISVQGQDIGHVTFTYGYSPAHAFDQDRAFRILKKEVEEKGNGREMYYLGREYYYRGDFPNCLALLEKYVKQSRFLAEKADAFLIMAHCYWDLKKGDEARDACAQALIINPNFKEASSFMSEIVWPRHAAQWQRMSRTADNSEVLFIRSQKKTLFLSPHDDDHALFGSFVCTRERPLVLVMTDSYIQPKRGEVGCDAETRAKETAEACKILGCDVERLGIHDDEITEEILIKKLEPYKDYDVVYVPAPQGGNPHHDLAYSAAHKVFQGEIRHYTTYSKEELYTKGTTEMIPSQAEFELKAKALECYQSQLNLDATRPHFQAVVGKSEWLI